MNILHILLVLFAYFSILFPVSASNEIQHHDIHGNVIDLTIWHQESSDKCLFLKLDNPINENTTIIQEVLDELLKAPIYAKYLLKNVEHLNTAFCIDDRADGTRGYYDYKFNIISVRKKLDFATKLIIYIHELRHVDHVSRNFCQSLDFHEKEMVRMTYAIEADANAFTALYAWQLKENGSLMAWNKLKDLIHYSDIPVAFENEFQQSGDKLSATRKAFEQWYKSKWRKQNYLKYCMSGYHEMLDDTNLIQKYAPLSNDFFNDLCTLPEGKNYKCHLTEEIKESIKIHD